MGDWVNAGIHNVYQQFVHSVENNKGQSILIKKD
jgi:hypothetical protein